VTDTTALAQLGRALRAAGVDQLYGQPQEGLAVLDCGGSAAVAAALARAHRQVHHAPAGVHLGDGHIVVGDEPTETLRISDTSELDAVPDAVATSAATSVGVRIELAVDPSMVIPERPIAPVPDPPRWVEPDAELVALVQTAERPMALVGPGVVGAEAVADLHALAVSADLGVLNTWGAKGVFDWRSRHHWATVGLQAWDLELGGLPESDLVVLSGIDVDELPPGGLDDHDTVTVAPRSIGPLAERWTRPRRALTTPVLRERLAAVTQDGWARDTRPLWPSRVTRTYGEVVGARGTVTADPGMAGFWVARTFGTTRLGGAVVPARGPAAGAGIAAALVVRLHRVAPVLAVGDGPLDELDAELLEAAARLRVGLAVERWAPDGEIADADEHRLRLAEAVASDRPVVLTLSTDPQQHADIVEAAGPVTAWSGR
jgi:thiamine pyrophosphate-dependent acetolactate synthase large subunit-like protein